MLLRHLCGYNIFGMGRKETEMSLHFTERGHLTRDDRKVRKTDDANTDANTGGRGKLKGKEKHFPKNVEEFLRWRQNSRGIAPK